MSKAWKSSQGKFSQFVNPSPQSALSSVLCPAFRFPLSAFRFPYSCAERLFPKKQSSLCGSPGFVVLARSQLSVQPDMASALHNDPSSGPVMRCLPDTTTRFARPTPCPLQTTRLFTRPRRCPNDPTLHIAQPPRDTLRTTVRVAWPRRVRAKRPVKSSKSHAKAQFHSTQ